MELARTYAFDALIVAAALVSALVAASSDDLESPRWLAAAMIAAVILPLLARRRYAFAAPASLWLLGAAVSFVDGRLVVQSGSSLAAGLVAALVLGNLADDRQARVGLGIAIGCAVIIVWNNPEREAGQIVFVPALVAIAWLAGYALRERSQRAEAAEAQARIAVAEERARIARELHDVVAHAVSVMVLQTGAVRHRLPDSVADDREALKGVEDAGRAALTEMRRMLGAMRRSDDAAELAPQPSLANLDALFEHVRRAGLPVHLHVEGDEVALPAGIDLSAYRIVQEGLTNALKYARASRADVTVRYADDALELEVRDDGDGGGTGEGGGHGLVGIRERVKILGGEMTAGPAPGRGYVLRARLPVTS